MGIRVQKNQISLIIKPHLLLGNISIHTISYCLTTNEDEFSCSPLVLSGDLSPWLWIMVIMRMRIRIKQEGNLEGTGSQKQWTLHDERSEHMSQVLSSLFLQQIIWLRELDDLSEMVKTTYFSQQEQMNWKNLWGKMLYKGVVVQYGGQKVARFWGNDRWERRRHLTLVRGTFFLESTLAVKGFHLSSEPSGLEWTTLI